MGSSTSRSQITGILVRWKIDKEFSAKFKNTALTNSRVHFAVHPTFYKLLIDSEFGARRLPHHDLAAKSLIFRSLNRSLGRVGPILSFTLFQKQGVNDTTPCQSAFWVGVMLFKFRKETRWTRSSPHTLH